MLNDSQLLMLGALVLILLVIMFSSGSSSSGGSKETNVAKGVKQYKLFLANYAKNVASEKNASPEVVRKKLVELINNIDSGARDYRLIPGSTMNAAKQFGSGTIDVTAHYGGQTIPPLSIDPQAGAAGAPAAAPIESVDGSRIVYMDSSGAVNWLDNFDGMGDATSKMLKAAMVGESPGPCPPSTTKELIETLFVAARSEETFAGRRSYLRNRMTNRRASPRSPYRRVRTPINGRRERLSGNTSEVNLPSSANNFVKTYISPMATRDCSKPGATDWSKEAAAEALIFAAMSGERSNSDEEVLRQYAMDANDLQCSGTVPSEASDLLPPPKRGVVRKAAKAMIAQDAANAVDASVMGADAAANSVNLE